MHIRPSGCRIESRLGSGEDFHLHSSWVHKYGVEVYYMHLNLLITHEVNTMTPLNRSANRVVKNMRENIVWPEVGLS